MRMRMHLAGCLGRRRCVTKSSNGVWLLWVGGRLWRRGISASLLLLLLLGADRLSMGMRARTHTAGALGLGRGARGIDLGVGIRLQDLSSSGGGLGVLEGRGCEVVAGVL